MSIIEAYLLSLRKQVVKPNGLMETKLLKNLLGVVPLWTICIVIVLVHHKD